MTWVIYSLLERFLQVGPVGPRKNRSVDRRIVTQTPNIWIQTPVDTVKGHFWRAEIRFAASGLPKSNLTMFWIQSTSRSSFTERSLCSSRTRGHYPSESALFNWGWTKRSARRGVCLHCEESAERATSCTRLVPNRIKSASINGSFMLLRKEKGAVCQLRMRAKSSMISLKSGGRVVFTDSLDGTAQSGISKSQNRSGVLRRNWRRKGETRAIEYDRS
jgi:hypothetical protein